jgi:putative oxidoreductase
MLASMFISGGINSLRNTDRLADRAAPVTEKLEPVVNMATQSLPFSLNQKQLVQVNGVVHVVGGLLLATGRVPRLSALALAATLVPTTLAGHRFWEESDAQQRANQQVHFFKNVSMVGGLLLASVDTEGKPSLAWMARQGAGRAKKRAAKQASKLTPS